MRDRLTDDWPRHWTGSVEALTSLIRIDGKTYRLMGTAPGNTPPMPQTRLTVFPTRSVYEFEADQVHIVLTFLSPLLPDDLNILSRPVTYLTWDVRAIDPAKHSVSLYFDHSAELVVNTSEQKVIWSRNHLENMTVLRMGSVEQPMLQKAGDDLRIDWGYSCLAIPEQEMPSSVMTSHLLSRNSFAERGKLPASDDLRMPRAAGDDWPVAAVAFDLGMVGAKPVSRHLLLVYDELYSIEFLERRLRPYWRREGTEVADLLKNAEKDYEPLRHKCEQFDKDLIGDLERVGGEKYARLAVLAYRQCLAAHTIAVDIDGTPLLFPKENFSNGCVSTVDVLYPSSPFFLLFNTRLMKAALTPVLTYASTERWRHEYAPHDLGTYPLANGQVYGGGEKSDEDQMPVEECGNMLLMVSATAAADGSAEYALKYWPLLEKWAAYLLGKGLDPENQLCTDDFAGHLAHNTNLSVKAILAIGGFSKLCKMAGKQVEAEKYRRSAEEFAAKWIRMADDGDHYRLAFDKPDTWSQKYNMVWDRILGLNLFPKSVSQKEISYYITRQNKYGLPLDNRKAYTKLDWEIWTATLAESPSDFHALIAPVFDFANESPSRVPLTDWYSTTDAKQVGFQARSVVGGIYIKMLSDPGIWKKWAGKSR